MRHQLLTVFNVRQGDSLLIRPEFGCKFNTPPLLVDTGSAGEKVADRIIDETVAVLITHSHADHIGGLPRLLRTRNVSELFIPYYLPEITRIHRYLQRFSKVQLNEPAWRRLWGEKVTLVAEGDSLCDHLTVMNPPRRPDQFVFGYEGSELEIDEALNILIELGVDVPRDEIVGYSTPIFSPELIEQNQGERILEYVVMSRLFVHRFFIALAESLRRLQQSSALQYEINRHIELTANQASIVFKYKHKNKTWLFTGDADEAVFNRLLMENKDISANYLKVPHHGSRGSLTRAILHKIRPEIAVVSHGNKKFGRSLDPHPHHEIVELLDEFGVKTYYTNPVLKKGVLIKPATVGTTPDGLIDFV